MGKTAHEVGLALGGLGSTEGKKMGAKARRVERKILETSVHEHSSIHTCPLVFFKAKVHVGVGSYYLGYISRYPTIPYGRMVSCFLYVGIHVALAQDCHDVDEDRTSMS